jgi:hypothetical protein
MHPANIGTEPPNSTFRRDFRTLTRVRGLLRPADHRHALRGWRGGRPGAKVSITSASRQVGSMERGTISTSWISSLPS